MNLADPVNATIADGQGVGTITDDDAPPSVDRRRHGDRGQHGHGDATFTVTLSRAERPDGHRRLRDRERHGHAPADYAAGAGTLTFAPGQTSRTITVLVNGDPLDEVERDVPRRPLERRERDDRRRQGVGTITDDDPLPASRSATRP